MLSCDISFAIQAKKDSNVRRNGKTVVARNVSFKPYIDNVNDISDHAIKYGYASATSGEISTRVKFTELQRLVEKAILKYGKANPNAKIIIAIHTPTPPTPLRLSSDLAI